MNCVGLESSLVLAPSSLTAVAVPCERPGRGIQVGAPAKICWPVRGYFAVVRHLEKVLHGHLAVEEVLIKQPLIGLEPEAENQKPLTVERPVIGC